jgi:hypothetical protein
MKNKTTLMVIISLLLTTLLISGCRGVLVTRNGDTEPGEMETRQFNFTEFTNVDIGSAFSYEIKQSDTYSISIMAYENLFDDIKVSKEGQTLKIEKDIPWTILDIGFDRPKAIINMPRLHILDSSGATNGIVSGFSSTDNMEITVSGASSMELVEIVAGGIYFDISGASDVDGVLEAKNIALEVSGASSVNLNGVGSHVDINASGASRLELSELMVNDADVMLSGASDCTLNVDGTLDVDLSGASKLEYIGEPTLGEMDISGASKIERK